MDIRIIKFFDRVFGFLVIMVLRLFKKEKSKTVNPNNILIIQLWGIGETILTLPAIKFLYSKNKNIDILTTKRAKEVFESFSYYSNLRLIEISVFSIAKFIIKNYRKYDMVIDMEEYLNVSSIIAFFAGKESTGFSHGARSTLYDNKVTYNDKQHVAKTFIDLIKQFDIDSKFDSLIKLNTDDKDKKIVDLLFKNLNIKSHLIVGIAPNVAESSKCRIWPISRFAELADYIIGKRKAAVIFIGGSEDITLIEDICSMMEFQSLNITGRLTLRQTFYFMEKLDLFIGNDSGPMHIAAAQKIRTIGLFGPNIPLRFAPYGKGNISIYKGDNCKYSPCINVHKGEVPNCYYPLNSSEFQKCMKNISVEDVKNSVDKIFGWSPSKLSDH